MDNPIKDVTEGFVLAVFTKLGGAHYDWVRKRRLRKKLRENPEKYPKGFRSTARLMDDIQADRETTVRLLHQIGARKSENSDEWKLVK